MKKSKKTIIGISAVAGAVTLATPLTACANKTEVDPEINKKTIKNTSNRNQKTTSSSKSTHPVNPINNQWFGAEVTTISLGTKQIKHFNKIIDAWNYVNSDDVITIPDVTFTLFEDWIADANGNFTEKYGCIRPESRNRKTDKLTIDLNGFKLDGNRQGKEPVGQGVLELRNNGRFIVKNGTITGGKTYTNGAGVFFDDDDCNATLIKVTISGNETINGKKNHNNGGGLYVKACDGTLKLSDVTIENNKASGFGGGVYWQAGGDPTFILEGAVTIVGNTASAGRNNLTIQKSNLSHHGFDNVEIETLSHKKSNICFDLSDQDWDENIVNFNEKSHGLNEQKILQMKQCFHLDSDVHDRYLDLYCDDGDSVSLRIYRN